MKRLRVELMAGEGARRRLTEKKCQTHGKTAIEVAVAKYAEQREAAAAKDAEEREAAAAPKKRRAPTESQRIGEPKNRCEVEKNRICHFHSLHGSSWCNRPRNPSFDLASKRRSRCDSRGPPRRRRPRRRHK